MVRIIGLIFVFGIVSFCLAAPTEAFTLYPQPPFCPCWSDVSTPIGTTELQHCDDVPNISSDDQGTSITAIATDTSGRTIVEATVIIPPTDGPSSCMRCDYSIEPPSHQCVTANNRTSILGTSIQDYQACLEDILAYCRDYNMSNP